MLKGLLEKGIEWVKQDEDEAAIGTSNGGA
jgi:hypothetical protein